MCQSELLVCIIRGITLVPRHIFVFVYYLRAYILHSYGTLETMSSLTLKSSVAENQRSCSSKREPYRFLPRLEVTSPELTIR